MYKRQHLYIDLKHDVKNNLKSNKLGTNVLNTLSHFRDKIKDEVIDAPLFKDVYKRQVTGSEEVVGKSLSDEDNHKVTAVSLLGLQGAKDMVASYD